ncbi:MAG: PA14 domain-containing protein [Patescibacteria group bacterium]
MKKYKSQQGAAALIASMVVSAGMLSIVLSVYLISMNMRESLNAFMDSTQGFYAAESGVGEALMQLRKEHNNYVFRDISAGGTTATSQFFDIPGECAPIPQCQFVPGTGWWSEYFNYSVTHPDMQVDPYPGPTPNPLEHDWYWDDYKTHEQIDANLEFATSMWFPYDGTIYENKEGYLHDYHFGMHWRAKVTAPSDGNYAYQLASDDDSWIMKNGLVVVNNSGTHAAFTKTGNIFLSSGSNNIVELYFAERHTVESGFSFKFTSPGLIITPWPEGCGDDIECNSHIESTAINEQAARKARYTCNQNIGNCTWSELIP